MADSKVSEAFRAKARLVDGASEPMLTIGEASAIVFLTYKQIRTWCGKHESEVFRTHNGTFYLTEAQVERLAGKTAPEDRLHAEVMALRDRVRRLEAELEKVRETKAQAVARRRDLSATTKALREQNARGTEKAKG